MERGNENAIIARYETAEHSYGAEFTEKVCRCAPEKSGEKILQHLSSVLGGADKTQIQKLIALYRLYEYIKNGVLQTRKMNRICLSVQATPFLTPANLM